MCGESIVVDRFATFWSCMSILGYDVAHSGLETMLQFIHGLGRAAILQVLGGRVY